MLAAHVVTSGGCTTGGSLIKLGDTLALATLSLYTAMTIVAIYKPWDRTPRGRFTAQQAADLRGMARKA